MDRAETARADAEGRVTSRASIPISKTASGWNVATHFLSSAAVAGAAFVTSREIVAALGERGYGVWSLLQGLLVFSAMAAGGIGPAIVRFVARSAGAGDLKTALSILRTSRRLIGAIALGAVVYGVLIGAILPFVFQIPGSMITAATSAWIILALASVVDVLTRRESAVLAGLQRHDLKNYVLTVITAVQAVVVVVAMRLGLGLQALAVAKLVSMAGLWLGWRGAVRRVFPASKRCGEVEPFALRELARFSSATFVIYLAGTLVHGLDTVVVGAILGAVSVAFYAPAVRIVDAVRVAGYALLNVVAPRAAELHGRGDRKALEELLYRASRMSLFLTGPVLVAGLAMGDLLLVRWLGDVFARSYPVVVALLVSQAVMAGAGPIGSALIAAGKASALARLEVRLAVLNLALSVWGCYRFGLLGPAVATTATSVFSGLVLQPRLSELHLGISRAPFLRNMARATVAIGLSWGAMHLWVRPMLAQEGLLQLMVKSVPFLLVDYLVFAVVVLDASDRRKILGWTERRSLPNGSALAKENVR